MRLLAAVLLVSCLALASASLDKASTAAYYEGRSGEILLKPADYREPQSFVTVLNKKLTSSSIDDVNVADLISHVSGRFLPLNPAVDRTEFPSINIFAPPRATVVASISSLSTDDIRFMASMTDQSFTPVSSTAYPSDSLARLTTMLSGVSPSVHGIVGSAWPTAIGLVTAYVSEFGQPRSANFPTLVANSFSGKSLVLSASGSAQFASAMNVMPALLESNPHWNNMQVFWNGNDLVSFSRVKNERMNAETVKAAAIKELTSFTNGKVEYDAATGSLVVSLVRGAAAKFNLNKPEDMQLIAELRMVGHIVSMLQANEAVKDLVADSIPDFFGLSFVSLEAIKAAYGAGSLQCQAAIALIDAALHHLNNAVKAAYSDAVVSVVLGVAAPARTVLPAAVMSALFSSEIVVLEPHPETFLPAIYVHVSATAAAEAQLCASLKEVTTPAGIDVECRFSTHHSHGAAKRNDDSFRTVYQLREEESLGEKGNDISSEDVQVFHTVLWTSIFIALAVGGTLLVMCSIDTTKDTLLFRVSKSGAAAHHRS